MKILSLDTLVASLDFGLMNDVRCYYPICYIWQYCSIPGIFADGGRNSLLDPLAHLLLLLGGDPHLYEAVVGAGRGLEQVGQHVGAHAVVLDTQRLEARVLVHHGAQGLYGEITQLNTENIYMLVKIFEV